MKIYIPLWLTVLLATGSICVKAQTVKGFVLEESKKGVFKALPYATVHWLGSTEAVVTDSNGIFEIKRDSFSERLVISYTGYISDTILIGNSSNIRVILASGKTLQEVEIRDGQSPLTYSNLDPLKTQKITEKELFKAACCNLSESFETNPSVDVAITDAVTGIRQIQMLGLSGNYTQITMENMSLTRGLASQYGLTFIPGPWIEGMQLSKGTGSVVNGRESIAGQINVELKKPESADKLYVNGYQNIMGRSELNVITAFPVSESRKWHSAVFGHASQTWLKNDLNGDGFLEIPLGYQLNLLNRWKYDNSKGFMLQLGIHALEDEKISGQKDFEPSEHKLDTQVYGTGINAKRLSAWSKIGYVFPQKKYQSIGLILNAFMYRQDSYFGIRDYSGKERSMSATLIYQSIIGNSFHKYRIGGHLLYDEFKEHYGGPVIYEETPGWPAGPLFKRTEKESGLFAEYTWSPNPKFDMVLGLRADFHNLFRSFITPRIHLRYAPDEKTTIRATAGSGSRTANIFTENISYLVSSRSMKIPFEHPPQVVHGRYYGQLMPEVALNAGINLTREFKFNYREASFHLDFYRTSFVLQNVTDLDAEPQELRIYSSYVGLGADHSYSNSIQAELDLEPLKRFELRLAYRWLDVKTQYRGEVLERPFISKDRIFSNFSYASKKKWKYDLTVTWNGRKRLPSSLANPEPYRMPGYSPAYFLVNAQVSKSIGSLDLYLGVENLLDFRQKKLIVSANDPFGPYFDASYVWGPTIGRMVYAGFRWKMK